MTFELSGLSRDVGCLAIIGMEKNTGKTTTLNYLLENDTESVFAITSIGYDGEDSDQITATHKPLIYVRKNTLVATAEKLLPSCDFTREILAFTNLHTPMGAVVILRALSDGFTRIAGPSTRATMNLVVAQLYKHGAERVIIDGAAARKSSAAVSAADGCILATGTAFSSDFNHLVDQTCHVVKLLGLSSPDWQLAEACRRIMEDGSKDCFVISADSEITNLGSSLDEKNADKLVTMLNQEACIWFGAAVTSRFIQRLLDKTRQLDKTTIVATDATRFLLDSRQYDNLLRRGASLHVLNPIRLVAVTVNPVAPDSSFIDADRLIEEFNKRIAVPVFNLTEDSLPLTKEEELK